MHSFFPGEEASAAFFLVFRSEVLSSSGFPVAFSGISCQAVSVGRIQFNCRMRKCAFFSRGFGKIIPRFVGRKKGLREKCREGEVCLDSSGSSLREFKPEPERVRER